jgi:cytochrome c oxidase assembly protein subunit 15
VNLILAVYAMALAQAGLGIATLLLVVPVSIAAAHQAGAMMLLTLGLWTAHELGLSRRSLPAPGGNRHTAL